MENDRDLPLASFCISRRTTRLSPARAHVSIGAFVRENVAPAAVSSVFFAEGAIDHHSFVPDGRLYIALHRFEKVVPRAVPSRDFGEPAAFLRNDGSSANQSCRS